MLNLMQTEIVAHDKSGGEVSIKKSHKTLSEALLEADKNKSIDLIWIKHWLTGEIIWLSRCCYIGFEICGLNKFASPDKEHHVKIFCMDEFGEDVYVDSYDTMEKAVQVADSKSILRRIQLELQCPDGSYEVAMFHKSNFGGYNITSNDITPV